MCKIRPRYDEANEIPEREEEKEGMELYLPALVVFLLAAAVTMFVIPRFAPVIIALFAAILLVVATYHHFHIFWAEYRQTTWTDTLKLFAPGIIILVLIVYLLFAIATMFTGGKVPIPEVPLPAELPSAETATNYLTSAINNTIRASNSVMNAVNGNANAGNRGNNVTRSFLATI